MTSASRHYWTSGNALSWVMGVLLGGLLGTILLIAVPRMLGGTAKTAEAPAASAPASEGTASAGAGASGEQAPAATSTETEASTAGETNPAVQTTAADAGAGGDAAAGKEKFATSCGGCHGMEAQGGMGPALAITKDWTDAQFTAAVREGKAPEKTLGAVMPHFTPEMLNDTDLANVHAFLKTLN